MSGGESYEGLRDGSAPGYFDDAGRLGYIPPGGFGFLRSGLLDTHTGAAGREGRAFRLAADTGHDRVYARAQKTATATTFETGPRFTVVFTKPDDFSAWTHDGTSAQTLIGMRIGITPR
ncbi:hypothetical protein ACH4ZX_27260 [Streptomyces sp. NPDC020490]|uniref:hypothetical protein n=1 Tax=Streptomyces sp. NPDC020490 TaxID=3365078 RepID=UPI00378E626A